MDLDVIRASLSDRYRIGEELGRGGMATVYRATDLRHGRDVALKILNDDMLGATSADRFAREIGITGRLTHPHILPLLDSGSVGGVPFYVMPLVGGETLRARLAREGALPVADAVTLAAEIASALDFAHRQGVVHRDVKPDNILLQDGHAMVADFGVAKALSAGMEEAAITATGVSVGTPAYMAPEQGLAQRDVDARADVYALGCVLYAMLTGSPPFHGATARDVISRHMTDPVPSMRSVRPTVPSELERVVSRALAKAPADRFATADAMREALLSAATSPATPGTSPTRKPSYTAVVALGIIGVALMTVLVATRNRVPARVELAGAADRSTRLAVLPMTNLGADTADAYFAAGMTDELISTLSDIAGVQVMARGAVVPYAGSTKSLADIGRELGVGSLIESTCRKDGNRLRISVRLVDVATMAQRWSQQYDRELTDAFAIQRDVARSVTQALRVQLSASESRALDRLPTTNAAAYEAYMRGRIAMGWPVTPESHAATIDWLQRAVRLDTGFALAHAMLGTAYVTQLFRFEPGPRYRALASAAVDRALALDSGLAEAYLARADLAYTPEAGWRLDQALADYLRALSLKPGLAQAHGALGSLLLHLGLPREALVHLRTAMSLDPSDSFAPPRVGRAFWYMQQWDSAHAAMRRAPMGPELGLVLGYLDRARDGLASMDSLTGPLSSDQSGDAASVRAVLYARLGDRARALEQLRIVERSDAVGTAHFHHAQVNVAMTLALLGERDRAVEWLEDAAAHGMPAYELFLNDPILSRLRGHPRYDRLMRREGASHAARKSVLSR